MSNEEWGDDFDRCPSELVKLIKADVKAEKPVTVGSMADFLSEAIWAKIDAKLTEREGKEKAEKEKEDKFRRWIKEGLNAPPIRIVPNINKTIKRLQKGSELSNSEITDSISEITNSIRNITYKFKIMKRTINFILCWIVIYSVIELCIASIALFN
jgi:hypothetical protein